MNYKFFSVLVSMAAIIAVLAGALVFVGLLTNRDNLDLIGLYTLAILWIMGAFVAALSFACRVIRDAFKPEHKADTNKGEQ